MVKKEDILKRSNRLFTALCFSRAIKLLFKMKSKKEIERERANYQYPEYHFHFMFLSLKENKKLFYSHT